MFSFLRLALISLLLVTPAFAVNVTTKGGYLFENATATAFDENYVFIGQPIEGLTGKPCVLVSVQTEAKNVSIKVSNIKREPVEYITVSRTMFLIATPGKQWVDIVEFDADKNIFSWDTVVVTVSDDPFNPDPPDPDPDPDPEPDPDPPEPPDVPEDPFDNIGRRVAEWSNGLPANEEVGKVFKKWSAKALNDPSLTTDDLTSGLQEDLNAISEKPQYVEPVFSKINADTAERWPMSKGVLSDYWKYVALGFGVE